MFFLLNSSLVNLFFHSFNIPNTTRSIDEESMRKVFKVINMLEEDDDVTNVFHDMDVPDDFEEDE